MIETLLANAIWAIPVLVAVSTCLIVAIWWRTPLGRRVDWRLIDFLWILSSAFTLYFLSAGLIYDRIKSQGQIAVNNYVKHIARGRDIANDNLETFCVGSSRRRLLIPAEEMQLFCRYNVDALTVFSTALLRYQNFSTIISESDLSNIPKTITALSTVGPDAQLAEIKWTRVRREFEFENEQASVLQKNIHDANLPAYIGDARIVWLYLFALIIALRLSKPIYEKWFLDIRVTSEPRSGAS